MCLITSSTTRKCASAPGLALFFGASLVSSRSNGACFGAFDFAVWAAELTAGADMRESRASGAGDAGAGVCACSLLTPKHKMIAAAATRITTLGARLIVFPSRVLFSNIVSVVPKLAGEACKD